MSKRKRTNKPSGKSTPPPAKKAPQKLSLASKIKQNWPIWVVSLLMACSLVGRFAASSARQVARTASSQPTAVSTVVSSQAQSNSASTAEQENFDGDLVVQDESSSTASLAYSLSLPTSWHNKIETSQAQNIVSFIYNLDETTHIPLFTLAAYTGPAWEKLQAADSPAHGEKLTDNDGVVVVDEIVLDETKVAQLPELKMVKDQLPQILKSFTPKPVSKSS